MSRSASPYLHTRYSQELSLFPWSAYRVVGVSIAAILVAVLPLVATGFVTAVATFVLVATIGSVGIQIVTGMAGQLSLGHAAFLAVGAYSVGGLFFHLSAPLWVGLPAAMLVGAVFGLLAGIPALRLRGFYLGITTLAIQSIVTVAATKYQSWLQLNFATSSDISLPSRDLGFIQLNSSTSWYYFLAILAMLAILVSTNLRRSKYGRAWTAVRTREVAAQAIGLDVRYAKLLAFVVAAIFGALAGAAHAYTFTTVRIESYDLLLSVEYLAMIIIGGLGSVTGAVLGAGFVTVTPFAVAELLGAVGLDTITSSRVRAIELGIFALITGGFLLFEPGGLVVIWRRIQSYFTRWPYHRESVQKTQR